jgi:trk system potassium uptake protein TrkA
MRVIIAGAGEVGTHLAKLLSRENIDISLMDERADRIEGLDADYDMLTMVGVPTSIRDLQEIGVRDVDLFVAVTPYESENMTACLIANQLGAKKTLARIDNYEYLLPENKRFFEQMGLNHLIYPEVLAAQEICESLKKNWMRYHLTLCNGLLDLCVVKIREGAPMVGKQFMSGFYAHGNYRIVAIKRGQETIIPGGADSVEVGDMIYAVCTRENMSVLRKEAGKSERDINNIVFFGGSKIAQKAIMSLPEGKQIKVLEADRELCERLSEKLGNALIIHADGSDMSVLKEEGIEDADAFVAVTERSEANIFACLAARRFGVRKTIAEIENMDYISMAEQLEVGSMLNKKTITASYIYRLLMKASVQNVQNLTSADAEIVEFVVTENSRITRDMIRNMNLPQECNIGAMVRAGEAILVNGDTQLLPGDQVVVFCKSNNLQRIEKLFK